MKKWNLFLLVLLLDQVSFSQSCLPEGITFTSQAQIDNFQTNYPNCEVIEGEVIIQGSSITNLNGLSVLTHLENNLSIHYNPALTSLAGLDNLTSIGGNLDFYYCGALTCMTGLNNLTSIGGSLVISKNNALTSLTGLDELTFIGDKLLIQFNDALTSLTGLGSLNSVGNLLDINYNNALTSLTGLEVLITIGGDFWIHFNDSLASIAGLNNLNSITGSLYIRSNNALTSIMGLDDLTSIGGNLTIIKNSSLSTCEALGLCDYLADPNGIVTVDSNASGCNSVVELANSCGGSIPCLPYGNYKLNCQADIDSFQLAFPNCTELEGNVTISGIDIMNLNGLSGVISIGEKLIIQNNIALSNLTGLGNLATIWANLDIRNNTALIGLTGLNNLTRIGGNLWIDQNHSLTSLTGLDTLNSIWSIWISSNNSLTSLSGLGNVTSLGGELKIGGDDYGGNPSLTSLTGLDNLTSIGGNLNIADNESLTSLAGLANIDAASISNLYIFSNNALSNCAVESICDYLASPNGSINIHNNATGCNSLEEVEAACLISVNEIGFIENQISIYPNPSNTAITIELPQIISLKNTIVAIFNLNGQELLQEEITMPATTINISPLAKGIYIVKIVGENVVHITKISKL